MFKHLWTTAIVSTVGLTLLLTPGISDARGHGSGGGSGGRGGGASYSHSGGRGNYGGYAGRGYYRGYGGLGWGWGYPGYYGGAPYYNGYDYWGPDGSYYANNPNYSFYPDESTQSYYPGTVPNQLQNANDAGFIVRVPDPNAEIWFQNYQTQQQGMVRHFESAPLDPNMTYTFTVRARWNQNGQMMDQTRQINARGGQNLTVDFTTPVHEQVPTLPQRTQ